MKIEKPFRSGKNQFSHRTSLESLRDRFERKIKKSLYCWIWLGAQRSSGYGTIWLNRKNESAHGVALMIYRGMDLNNRNDLHIHHKCFNRLCVNPDHLMVVDARTNILASTSFAAINAMKTQCDNGHPLGGENLYLYAKKNNKTHRSCKVCRRENLIRWRKKNEQKRIGDRAM